MYDIPDMKNGYKPKDILSLSASEALDFLMESEQYHSIELPEYFEFDGILGFVKERVGERDYSKCLASDDSKDAAGANFEILTNKDGKYGVRPLTLANPYLYYFTCREICNKEGWTAVQDCFRAFRSVPHISSCAVPILPEGKDTFHKSSVILNWWNRVEQRSLELSLRYRYMFMSDITNCYGSIQLDSIRWAMQMKGTAMADDKHTSTADSIIKFLKQMQQGRTVGIPQGSTLFDFIAEIVLGYSDLLLNEAIQREIADGEDFGEYEILRYRDDYRIFCDDRDKLEKLSYILQHTLERLNLRMNTQKTFISDSIVTDAIKQDKLFYIFNTPVFNKKGCDFDGIQKHLLYILMFARKYPNASQLKNMLSDLDGRIKQSLNPKKGGRNYTWSLCLNTEEPLDLSNDSPSADSAEAAALEGENKDTSSEKGDDEPEIRHIKENKRAIIAIATQLAVENVTVVNYALRIISRLLNDMEDEQERRDTLNLVCARLQDQPNSDYAQLWLQNITYKNDEDNHTCPYSLPLCRLVANEKDVNVWNNSWLKPELTAQFPIGSMVNRKTLAEANSIVAFKGKDPYGENAPAAGPNTMKGMKTDTKPTGKVVGTPVAKGDFPKLRIGGARDAFYEGYMFIVDEDDNVLLENGAKAVGLIFAITKKGVSEKYGRPIPVTRTTYYDADGNELPMSIFGRRNLNAIVSDGKSDSVRPVLKNDLMPWEKGDKTKSNMGGLREFLDE